MDIETITKLIDAGYTKAEIDAMQTGHDDGGTTDKNAGETNPDAGKEQSTPNEKNASEVNQPVEITAAIEALTNTVAGLQETVKAIQNNNVANASTDKPKKDSINEAINSFMEKF